MKKKYSLKLVMENYLNEEKQKIDSKGYSIEHEGGRQTFHELQGKDLVVKHIDPSGKTDQVVKMTIQKSKKGSIVGFDNLNNPREIQFNAKEYGIKSGETVNDPYVNSIIYLELIFPAGFEARFKRVGTGGKRAGYFSDETLSYYNYSIKGFNQGNIESNKNWKEFDTPARREFFGYGDSKKSVLGSEVVGYYVYKDGKKYKPLKEVLGNLITDTFSNVEVNKALEELDRELGKYDKDKQDDKKDLNESLSRGSLYRRRYRRY